MLPQLRWHSVCQRPLRLLAQAWGQEQRWREAAPAECWPLQAPQTAPHLAQPLQVPSKAQWWLQALLLAGLVRQLLLAVKQWQLVALKQQELQLQESPLRASWPLWHLLLQAPVQQQGRH